MKNLGEFIYVLGDDAKDIQATRLTRLAAKSLGLAHLSLTRSKNRTRARAQRSAQLIHLVFCLFGVLFLSETFGATSLGHGDEALAGKAPLMALPGTADVDANGAFTYSIPIEVPPGTRGMVPQLSLNYSSRGGDGVVGFGWELRLTASESDPRHQREEHSSAGGSPIVTAVNTVLTDNLGNALLSQMAGAMGEVYPQSGVLDFPIPITRCARTFAQDGIHGGVNYDANDRLCLNGQRLIAISGPYGADGTQYRTEIESFSKIISHGQSGNGPAWFEVHTKSGLTIQFGNTADSQAQLVPVPGSPTGSSGTIRAWAINRISDAKGNFFTITYNSGTPDTTNGQIYPTLVSYTGNSTAGVAPYNSIQFTYTTRNDVVPHYQAGSLTQTTVLLSDIKTYAGVGLVSDYHLSYNLAPANSPQHDDLNSVTRCDANGICLAPTTFGWQGTTIPPVTSTSNTQVNGGVTPIGTLIGVDLNGDGLTDVLSVPSSAYAWSQLCVGQPLQTYIANSNVAFSEVDYALNYSSSDTMINESCVNNQGDGDYSLSVVGIGDIDGDGLPDLAVGAQFTLGGAGSYFLRNDGRGHFNQVGPEGGGILSVGDFDGDGRLDGNGIGNGDGTFSPFPSALYSAPSGSTNILANVPVGDFAGSGCIDTRFTTLPVQLLQNGYVAYGCYSAVSQSTLPPCTVPTNFNGPVDSNSVQCDGDLFADFNGDGKMDLLIFTSWKSNGTYLQGGNVYLSTGTGFVKSGFVLPVITGIGELTYLLAQVGDFNGDGKADLLLYGTAGEPLAVLFSTGTGFTAPVTLTTITSQDSPRINYVAAVGDWNSDGASDVWLLSASRAVIFSFPYVPEAIASVSDGIGETTNVTYDRINKNQPFYTKCPNNPSSYLCGTTYPTQAVDAAMYVVSTVSRSNGIGGSYVLNYAYAGAEKDLSGRGFLGFSTIKIADPQSGIVTTRNYSQSFPLSGYLLSETDVTTSGSAGCSAGVSLNRKVNTPGTANLGGTRNFVFTSQSVVQHNDCNGAALPTVTTTNQYDCESNPSACYGELDVSTVVTSLGSDTRTVMATSTYLDDTTDWCFDRPTSEIVNSVVGSSNMTRTTNYAWTSCSLTQKVVEPNSSTEQLMASYTPDSFGNIIQTTISGSNIATRTTYGGYDSLGEFQTSFTDAYGHIDRYAYDARFGGLTGQTDVNGLVTTWSYDTFGRETNETRPDGTETLTTYVYCSGVNGGSGSCPSNGAYFSQATQMASNGVTQIGPMLTTHYDSLDRKIATDTQGFDGSTIRTSTPYDALGRVAQTSRPYFLAGGTPQWTVFTYDALGRPTQANAPNGEVTTTVYNGLAVSMTNTDNTNVTSETNTTTKNAEGQIASVTDALNNTTHYSYDAFDDLTQITDIAGNITQYTYDLRGHKLTAQDPDLGNWQYGYDALGELTSQTDANNNHVTLSYDLEQRLVNRVEPDLNSSWTYGTTTPATDKLTSATTAAGYQQALTYDSKSRPIQTVLTVGGSNYTYATGYNAQNGKIASISYPSGFGINYAYTSLGYLSQINDATTNQNYWTVSQRDAGLHPTSQSFGNGVAETNTYDATTGLLTNVRAGASNGIAQFDYQYDLLGNLIYRSDDYQGIFEEYCFDALNRLTNSATGTTGAGVSSCTASGINIADKTIGYDALGDITSKSDAGIYAYPATGQARPHAVTSITGTVNGVVNPTFAYDNNGNMTSGDGRTVTYSSFNMADQITQGTTTIAFTYDTEHARIAQVGPAGTTTYLNDPSSGAMAEQVVNGSTTTWHDYVLVPGSENGAGAFLAEHTGGGTAGTATNWGSTNWGSFTWSGSVFNMLYFTADHLGSIAVVADQTGSPSAAERDSYDAWGKRRNAAGTDNAACSVTSETTRGFTHQEQMDSICLVNFNARVYDPTLGRFMAADPITAKPYDPQSLSRYTYVDNRPLDTTDPSGETWADLLTDPSAPLAAGEYFGGAALVVVGALGDTGSAVAEGASVGTATPAAVPVALASTALIVSGEAVHIDGFRRLANIVNRNDADKRRVEDQRDRRRIRRENQSRDLARGGNGQNRSGEGFRDHESAEKGPRGDRPSGPNRDNNRERNIGIDEEHSMRPKGQQSY